MSATFDCAGTAWLFTLGTTSVSEPMTVTMNAGRRMTPRRESGTGTTGRKASRSIIGRASGSRQPLKLQVKRRYRRVTRVHLRKRQAELLPAAYDAFDRMHHSQRLQSRDGGISWICPQCPSDQQRATGADGQIGRAH